MKPIKKETKLDVSELSKEELENTFGGVWWEIIFYDDKMTFIFHPFDSDKPK